MAGAPVPAGSPPVGVRALLSSLAPRLNLGQLVSALLLGLLGFGLAVQVRTTQAGGLEGLRESDLVRILDDTSERSARLSQEAAQLEETRRRLSGGTDTTRAALQEAQARANTVGILAGTLPAVGPGISMRITDPRHQVTADRILDAVQELRDAGSEAMQIGGAGSTPVRIVASTYFVDAASGGIVVDGTTMFPPYTLLAIGQPETMTAALNIPGGVNETLREFAATAPVINSNPKIEITALRQLSAPKYAHPAPAPSPAGS